VIAIDPKIVLGLEANGRLLCLAASCSGGVKTGKKTGDRREHLAWAPEVRGFNFTTLDR